VADIVSEAEGETQAVPSGEFCASALAELTRRAQASDPIAMTELIDHLSPWVGRICGSIALSRGEDAMQETFIIILRSLHTLREPDALYGWVRRIAVHEALRQVRSGHEVTVAIVPDLYACDPFHATDTALDVHERLTDLAPIHRAVLVLRDLEGLTERQTAEILHIDIGTTKSRLHRARTAFARKWTT
jgi:RNA polymerase sigma factor (sigma-70 family)